MRPHTHWRGRLDEVHVRISVQHHLWRAVDHEGEGLESFATKTRDKAAALRLMKKLMKRHGCAEVVTTDGLRYYYKAALNDHFNQERHLVNRDQFRERRSAALAEWRTLAA